MSSKKVLPSTLNGVKRLANQIKKSRDIPHYLALDESARAGGYQNYRHARNVLQERGAGHMLFITVYWQSRRPYQSGRETITFNLTRPLEKICSKSELKVLPPFQGMRLVADDHLVSDQVAHSQDFARGELLKATRTLTFMDGTGLRPLRGHRLAYPEKDGTNRPPFSDHMTQWYDPYSGKSFLINEPYRDPALNKEDQAWADKHGWYVGVSSWSGMYFPGRCALFLATDCSDDYDVEGLMRKIDALPMSSSNEAWSGLSMPNHDTFISPMSKTPQDYRRAKSKGTVIHRASKKTIPYGNGYRRPNSYISIEDHREIGEVIKELLYSEVPFLVDQNLNQVRSTLEDWFFAEHGISHRRDLDFDPIGVYYYSNEERAFSRSGHVEKFNKEELLEMVGKKLIRDYNECEPLRQMIAKIDRACLALNSENLQDL